MLSGTNVNIQLMRSLINKYFQYLNISHNSNSNNQGTLNYYYTTDTLI